MSSNLCHSDYDPRVSKYPEERIGFCDECRKQVPLTKRGRLFSHAARPLGLGNGKYILSTCDGSGRAAKGGEA